MRRRGTPSLSLRPAGALYLALVLCGCGGSLATPPVEVSSRDSLIGAGKVIKIASTSNEELSEVSVKIVAPSGEERTWREERLGPYASFELGWKKLEGWEIPPGSRVTVRSKGYLRAFRGTLDGG